MIAVDTNIVARFCCDDPDDPESKRQRPAARRARRLGLVPEVTLAR